MADGLIWAGSRVGPNCARPTRVFPFPPPIPVAVNSKGVWVGCPIVRASDEHCFIVRVLRAQGLPPEAPPSYTGHSSSFHAISQNIHSYRELITNTSSIRRFSSLLAVLAHWSTFLRIQRCTSANSGDA